MLFLLLSCLLPVAHGKSCLLCWPELPALMDYDLQVLWGTPGPPAELSQSIHSLFREDNTFLRPWYLGQEHLEEEAAKLFNHIEESIKKMRDNKQLLMDEIHVQKKLFSKKLSERSEELKEKDLHILEVMDCARCKMHYLTCRDAKLCPGRAQSTYIWAASLFFIIPLASIAGGGYYFFWIVKKKKEEKVLRKKIPVRI